MPVTAKLNILSIGTYHQFPGEQQMAFHLLVLFGSLSRRKRGSTVDMA
jgi:hypothetical protein